MQLFLSPKILAAGNRVQGTVNGVTTTYVNSSYEVSGGVGASYYFAEGQRIAMRKSGVVSYLLPDHSMLPDHSIMKRPPSPGGRFDSK